jgi:hypothetical protein
MANYSDSNIIEGLLDTKSFRTQAVVQATSASTMSLLASSELLMIFTGATSGQSIQLTDATTISIGHRYEVHNNSTADISIKDNAGTILAILTAGQRVLAILQIAGTTAGTWSIIESEKIAGQTSGSTTSLFNEFLLDVFHTHSMIDTLVLNGGISTMDTATTDNTYSGSFTEATGTAVPTLTTMGKAYAFNNTSLTIKAGGQTIEWRIRLKQLGGNTNASPRFDVKAGTMDNDAVGDPANGIYFQYMDNLNGGSWTCVTSNASTRTVLNSSSSPVANTWVRLKYIVNVAGTSVSFYIDDVFVGTTTTNIPSNNGCRIQVSIEKEPFNIATFLPAAVNITTDVITLTNTFTNTDRVVFTTTTTLPAPLSAATIYFVVSATATNFKVSTTSGGAAVNLTAQGTGTHTVSQVSGTSSSMQADWYVYTVTR